eukprot:TRINITY_DN2513_c0_g2_i10.p1 TRINITY_DN2513_c0_g2~~TRINITY_DN2513_c0_g2_i10.p1  ORF type:complete len:222 (+),score=30.54 TRINITY_DN2513_c0_g2_i10:178-843(+)
MAQQFKQFIKQMYGKDACPFTCDSESTGKQNLSPLRPQLDQLQDSTNTNEETKQQDFDFAISDEKIEEGEDQSECDGSHINKINFQHSLLRISFVFCFILENMINIIEDLVEKSVKHAEKSGTQNEAKKVLYLFSENLKQRKDMLNDGLKCQEIINFMLDNEHLRILLNITLDLQLQKNKKNIRDDDTRVVPNSKGNNKVFRHSAKDICEYILSFPESIYI